MRQSNAYVIGFSAGLTIILGGLLAFASLGLRPIQQEQVTLDTQKKILGAVMKVQPGDDVLTIYKQRIRSLVVNAKGEEVKEIEGEPIIAENVDIGKQFKLPPEDRLYPVFKLVSEENPEEADSYILPVFGNGLWNSISGYIALEKDMATLRGAVFDHVGETPGLGARITSLEVQNRFKGKKIYDGVGELVGVSMVKGETGDPSIYGDNEVDGMSGATLTAIGVNNMLRNYLGYYEPYLEKATGNKVDKPNAKSQNSEV